jgi:two-component system, cell cycle response regulator
MEGWRRGADITLKTVFALTGAWLVIDEFRVVTLGAASLSGIGGRRAYDTVLVSLAVVCLARAVASRQRRGAWLLISLGMLAWAFGEIYYNAVLWTQTNPPVPSPADGGYLAFYPLCLAGLTLLLRDRAGRLPPMLWVDGLTTALSVGALSAAIVFQQVVRHDSGAPLSAATALAYPVLDMILLAGVLGALARMGWRADRTWLLLAAGVLLFWVADSMYELQTAAGTYHPGTWYDPGWYFGFYLIAAAAWQPQSVRLTRRAEATMRPIAIPLLFGGLGLGLLVYGAIERITGLAIALAAASLIGVMVRLLLTFRENITMLSHSRGEALTDPLTGLANRRALTRRLEEVFAPEGDEEWQLILFDLDGFKAYNDRFGHPAGDALLKRLAERVSAEVGRSGEVFRMGGDEFCVLIPRAGNRGESQLAAMAGALSENGDGFQVGCSYGAIALPGEAESPSEALRIVDRSMYSSKHQGRASARCQARDVLLRAMAESGCGFDAHSAAVAELAGMTARAMGLSAERVLEIRQAGELHDVGMIAIPRAILEKPGELGEAEWTFLRQHPRIGERIIAAAPALEHIAGIVRHSHERWDGAGYPDGLAGDEIPVGARIIAVAEAFDTMTKSQPYREAISEAAAVSELRRHAGTQFDPVAVDSLVAAIRDCPRQVADTSPSDLRSTGSAELSPA